MTLKVEIMKVKKLELTNKIRLIWTFYVILITFNLINHTYQLQLIK